MTIKEIEERSGLTRANIRFYESEGLFTPERKPNGYRDYSEENLETLLRIRLLRSLHIPLEEIKALQAGEGSLDATLERHLQALEEEKAEAARAQAVCRVMQGDRAEYATLDARRYLEELERRENSQAEELTGDVIPRVTAPWRRYAARMFDFTLYSFLLWDLPRLFLGFNVMELESLLETVSHIVVSVVLMLLLEPLLLSRFKTTPGKAILGLYVTDLDGSPLTYQAASQRTWKVIRRGMGYGIPIYNIVRYIRCYYLCQDGRPLEWEEDGLLTLRENRYATRVLSFAAACVVMALLFWGASYQASLPLHRGDLTVKEFCANYNRMLRYHQLNTVYRLKSDGTWQKRRTGDWLMDSLFAREEPAEITFTEEDGVLTGVTLHMRRSSGKDDGAGPYDFYREMEAAIRAFAYAQKGISPRQLDEILAFDYLPKIARWEDAQGETFYVYSPPLGEVSILCITAQEGYDKDLLAQGWLSPAGRGRWAWMEITFIMTTGELPDPIKT